MYPLIVQMFLRSKEFSRNWSFLHNFWKVQCNHRMLQFETSWSDKLCNSWKHVPCIKITQRNKTNLTMYLKTHTHCNVYMQYIFHTKMWKLNILISAHLNRNRSYDSNQTPTSILSNKEKIAIDKLKMAKFQLLNRNYSRWTFSCSLVHVSWL